MNIEITYYDRILIELINYSNKQDKKEENVVDIINMASKLINDYDDCNNIISIKESKKIYILLNKLLTIVSNCEYSNIIDALKNSLDYILQDKLLAKRREDSTKMKTYIIQNKDTKYYKIGRTSQDINKRIDQIKGNAASDLELVCLINKNIETLLHREFEYDKVYSEWFHLTDSDILGIRKEHINDIIFIKEFK